MDVLKAITQEQIRTDLPKLEIGDYVKLYVKVKEGAKERIFATTDQITNIANQ